MTADTDPGEAAIIAAGVRALGWGDAVSHIRVLTRDVVRTTGLVRHGQRFIMKQFPAGTCLALLRERVSILRRLVRSGQPVPRMVTAEPVSFAGFGHRGWLIAMEYLPGDPLTRLSIEDFEDLGAKVGELHLRLREVEFGLDWATHALCSLRRCCPGPAASGTLQGHLCHGDLHVGNVIRGSDGYAFIDFDEMALADQISDVAALLGIPMLRRYQKQALAILRGYAGTLTDPAEADLVYGPELLRALARRYRNLAPIQRTPSSGPNLVALADDLAAYASQSGVGLDGWLARGG